MGLCGSKFNPIEKRDLKSENSEAFSNFSKNGDINNDRTKSSIPQVNLNHFEKRDLNTNKKAIISFEATCGEKEYPILLNKNDLVEIEVISKNCDNKYSFIPEEGYTDFAGYKNILYNNNNLGCLIIRISTSVQKIYMATENIKFRSWETGSLILSANLDPNNYNIYEPNGTIFLNIFGEEKESEEIIDKNTGYNLNQAYAKFGGENIQLQILRYINKARIEVKKYISDFIYEKFEFFKKMKKMSLYSYKLDNNLCIAAEKHCEDLCVNGISGHIDSNGKNLEERMKQDNIDLDEYSESIFFGINNPIEIVNELIIDRYSKNLENRKNIYNQNFTKVGIAIQKHIAYRYCCVIIFGK